MNCHNIHFDEEIRKYTRIIVKYLLPCGALMIIGTKKDSDFCPIPHASQSIKHVLCDFFDKYLPIS